MGQDEKALTRLWREDLSDLWVHSAAPYLPLGFLGTRTEPNAGVEFIDGNGKGISRIRALAHREKGAIAIRPTVSAFRCFQTS
jgi:hypothetical protein